MGEVTINSINWGVSDKEFIHNIQSYERGGETKHQPGDFIEVPFSSQSLS